MLRFTSALAGLLTFLSIAEAPAEPNYAVWSIAHERMLAEWRYVATPMRLDGRRL